MNAIEIKDFTKTYGQTVAVANMNLTVPKGQFFGLLGHNGAGKTTTIKCMTGTGMFTQGSMTLMGHDVNSDYQQARMSIGLSPQEFNVDIFTPVEFVLDVVGGYFGMPKAARQQRIEELLDLLGLQEHRKKKFKELSGGLKRRLILARAMMHDPDILILDEPTAGIDVEQRHALWEQLQQLHKSGKTIFLTSHYLEEVEKLCERVAIMHKGEVIADLNKKQFAKHGSLEETYLKLTKSTV